MILGGKNIEFRILESEIQYYTKNGFVNSHRVDILEYRSFEKGEWSKWYRAEKLAEKKGVKKVNEKEEIAKNNIGKGVSGEELYSFFKSARSNPKGYTQTNRPPVWGRYKQKGE